MPSSPDIALAAGTGVTGEHGRRRLDRRRAVRDGLVIAGLVYLAYRFLVIGPASGAVGADAFAYWRLDPQDPYGLPNGTLGAFLYPPPMVRVFAPAGGLPWVDFWWLWTALLLGTVVWLGWRRTLLVLAFPPVALELFYGNVNLLIAAAIALGFATQPPGRSSCWPRRHRGSDSSGSPSGVNGEGLRSLLPRRLLSSQPRSQLTASSGASGSRTPSRPWPRRRSINRTSPFRW
ncbi:MAG TPA: glycosyltransferase family 87 protein [Candidatus Eisenbacteria bacterium]|nr:glycosyltransferase family 87 protein [Candidatus Eisenbacteria bacterium]